MNRIQTRLRGLTLVEILIVTSIMAVLMGISVGFISKLNRVVGLKAEIARVDAVLRKARNTASTDETSAVVLIAPDRNSIAAMVVKTVGQWHFEDEITTGFGTNASVSGPKLTSPSGGKIGRCFSFDKGGTINCGNPSSFNLPLGLTFEAWVFPADSNPCVIAQKGKGFKCGLDGGNFYARLRDVGEASSAQRRLSVPPGRWSHVRLDFDGFRLRVYVNGALGGSYPREREDRKKGAKPAAPEKAFRFTPDEDSDLLIGGEKGQFRGRIDEVRMAGISGEEIEYLSEAVQFIAEETSDLEIHFDASGKLDPAWHEKPAVIVLASRAEKTKKETITLGMTGVVE